MSGKKLITAADDYKHESGDDVFDYTYSTLIPELLRLSDQASNLAVKRYLMWVILSLPYHAIDKENYPHLEKAMQDILEMSAKQAPDWNQPAVFVNYIDELYIDFLSKFYAGKQIPKNLQILSETLFDKYLRRQAESGLQENGLEAKNPDQSYAMTFYLKTEWVDICREKGFSDEDMRIMLEYALKNEMPNLNDQSENIMKVFANETQIRRHMKKSIYDVIDGTETDAELEALAETIIEAVKGKDYHEYLADFLEQGLSEEEAEFKAEQLYKHGPCQCGSGLDKHEQYDYHGIYAGRMCDKCFKEKFRQDDYTLDTDERLGDDDFDDL